MIRGEKRKNGMKKDPSAILGVPFNNDGIRDIVEESLLLLKQGKQPKLISTYNGDIVAKTHGWICCGTLCYPELLSIVRRTKISTTSSKYLQFLSRCLGSPILETIDSKELVEHLCKELGKIEGGIFLLGGDEKTTKYAAVKLRENSPGLRIVGIATPPIYVTGEQLVNAFERDALLVEQINQSNADVLLINLGSPKQEIWFERVRHKVRVPLILFSGDVLDQYSEGIMDRSVGVSEKGNGWFWPLMRWFKMGWMSIPLIFYHNINRLVCYLWPPSDEREVKNRLYLSSNRTIAVVSVPPILDESTVDTLKKYFGEAVEHDVMVFDFRRTRHIQPEGFRLLMDLWRRRRDDKREVYGYCPSRDLVLLMKMHRVWDVFREAICHSPHELMAQLIQSDNTETFYDTVYQEEENVVINFIGALDNAVDKEAYLEKLIPMIGKKNCVLDLSFCTYIDNSGFAFLLNLQKVSENQGNSLKIRSMDDDIRRQFKEAGVLSYFKIDRLHH